MKKLTIFYLLIFIGITPVAFSQPLISTVFNWEKMPVKKNSTGEVKSFFKGVTRDLKIFEMKAVSLNPGKEVAAYKVAKASDEMIIIKEGMAEIKINDVTKTMGEGSVIVIPAGAKLSINNKQSKPAVYYSFVFKPLILYVGNIEEKIPLPLFVDWTLVEFKANARGGRRDIMRQPTSSMRELEIHVTTLKAGIASHPPHTHPDEEIILMRSGMAEMDLDGKLYQGGPGSLFYLAGDGMHGIKNIGNSSCEYYAIRWLTGPALR